MAYLINAYLSTRFEKIVDVTPASRHRQLGLRSEIRSLYTCLIPVSVGSSTRLD